MNAKQNARRIASARLRAFRASPTAPAYPAHSLFTAQTAYQRARTVFFYAPLPLEIDPYALAYTAENAGKHVALPRVSGNDLHFHAVTYACTTRPSVSCFTTLCPRTRGIREPDAHSPRLYPPHPSPNTPAQRTLALPLLIVVPALAFSTNGARLGRGEGHYDRFLARIAATIPAGSYYTLGLCFDCQIMAVIPQEAHDQSVHAVLTETRLISCATARAPAPPFSL